METSVIRKTSIRIDQYDIAKGIGILLVVIGHSLPNTSFWRSFIYSFHIPLFFFLSGLVISESQIQKSPGIILRRDLKLLANFLFWSLLYFIYDVIYLTMVNKLTLTSLLLDIYLIVTLFGISVLWFLSSLLLGKWLTAIVCRKYRELSWRILIVCILYIGGSGLALLLPDHSSISSITRIIYYPICTIIRTIIIASFILLGYTLKDNINNVFKSRNISMAGFVAVLSFLLLLVLCRYTAGTDFHYADITMFPLVLFTSIIGISMVLSCSYIIANYKIWKNALRFFGVNSLFIMTTHEFFGIKMIIDVLLIQLQLSSVIVYGTKILLMIGVECLLIILVKPLTDKIVNLSFKVWKERV